MTPPSKECPRSRCGLRTGSCLLSRYVGRRKLSRHHGTPLLMSQIRQVVQLRVVWQVPSVLEHLLGRSGKTVGCGFEKMGDGGDTTQDLKAGLTSATIPE